VACETLVNTGLVVVSGEISTTTYVDIQDDRARDDPQDRLHRRRPRLQRRLLRVINAIDKQSPDIAQGVDSASEARTDPDDDDELDVAGAGDQGMMFGYALERDRRAHAAARSRSRTSSRSARRRCAAPTSCPTCARTARRRVSVRYRDGRPAEIEKLLISTQHREGAESLIADDLWEHVVEPILPEDLYDARSCASTSS
jgi:S-adenosylmethionine synthetase